MQYNPEELREKYKELFEYSLDIVFVIDLVGNLLDANDVLLKKIEYIREELPNLNFRDLLDDEELRKANKNVKDFVKIGHQSSYTEYKVKTKSGANIFIETFGIPLIKNGEIYGILCIAKDITDLKNAQESLKRSEKKYRDLFETTPFSIVLLNSDGIVVDCNPTLERMFGYKKAEILGRHFGNVSIIHQDFLSYLLQLFTKLLKGEEVHRTDIQMYRKDGNLIWATIQATNVKIGGNPYVQVVIHDITKRKNLTQKLLESENLYKTLVRTSPDAIIVTDLKGKIIEASQKAIEIYGGSTVVDLIGENSFDFIHPEDKQKAMENLQKTLKGETSREEYRLYRKDGTQYIGELSATLIKDADGNPKAFIGIMRDITERKLAEKWLKESEEQYRHLYQNAPISLWTVRISDGKFIRANENAGKIVGYDNLDDFLNNCTSMDIVPADYRKEFMAKLKEKGEITGIEANFIDKKGNEKHITISAKLYEEKGYFEGVSTDITELKKMQKALQASEENYRHLFQNLPVATYVWQKFEESINLIDYNEAAEIITSGGVKDFIGIAASELYKDRPDILRDLYRCIEEKTQINKEIKYTFHTSKLEKILKVNYAYIPPDLILVHTEDISDLKRTEQMLKESEEKYRLISENANDLIAIFSQLAKFEYVNEAHLEVLGYLKEDLIGKSVSEFIHPRDVRLLTNILSDLVKYSEGRTELRFRKKDGTYLWLDIRGKTFIEKSGELKGLTISRNITEKKEAEQRLKDSEEQYRATINSFSDPLHVVDKDLKIILANPAFERWLISLEVDENIVGKSIFEAFPFLPEIVRKQYEQVFSSGIPHFSEENTVIGDREIITESRKIPIFKGDKVDQVVTILRDITAKKAIENKLRASETKYRHLFESAPFLIGLADLDGKVLALNSSTNKFITTHMKDELIGKNFREIFSFHEGENAIIPKAEEQIDKLLKGEVTDFFEFPLVRADGSVQWVNLNLSLINIEDQTLIQLIMQDITKRKITEQQLKRSEQKFRRIFESIPDFYFLISSDGIILDFRGKREELYVPPEDFLGKNIRDIFPRYFIDLSIEAINKTIETKEPTIIEYSLPIRGEERYYEARVLYFSKNQVAIFVREITERKKAELLVEEEFEKLKELEHIRKDLISRVSHELKTPLIPVISGSELLMSVYNHQIGKEAREIIEMIDKGGRRLKELIEQLLNVSRIEYDKLKLEKKRNDLSKIIIESSNDMKYLFHQRKLTLKLDIPDEFWIDIDKNRIGEVITNLLSNAMKFTPPFGKITINLHEKDDWAILSVNDTGVGLTEKEMAVLFTRFGKIDRYNEGLEYIDIKGSGLGLYICKEILKMHGGEIWAQSDGRNKGSTFIVKLPIR
ncbi:MAG: PAS domain S-box protein [Promethearchaeota archaeon]